MQAESFAWQATTHSDTVEHNLLIPCIGNTHDMDNSKGVRYTFLHASNHTRWKQLSWMQSAFLS